MTRGLAMIAALLMTISVAEARPRQPSPTPAKTQQVKGEIQVLWGGSWWEANVLDQREGFVKVHYVGWSANYDEWVEDERVRQHGVVEAGPRGQILWGGQWWPGRVLDRRAGLIQVSYDGHGPEWNSWVEPKRVRSK